MLVILVMTFCTVAGDCMERDAPMGSGLQACMFAQPIIAEYMRMEALDLQGYTLARWRCDIGGKRTNS